MKALLPLATCALTACATVPPAGDKSTAAIAEYILIAELRIRPIRVIEDSRCPMDVHCVWAGRIIVETEISGGAPYQIHMLELGKPARVAFAGGTLTLVSVEPGKMAGSDIKQDAYRFTFRRGR